MFCQCSVVPTCHSYRVTVSDQYISEDHSLSDGVDVTISERIRRPAVLVRLLCVLDLK